MEGRTAENQDGQERDEASSLRDSRDADDWQPPRKQPAAKVRCAPCERGAQSQGDSRQRGSGGWRAQPPDCRLVQLGGSGEAELRQDPPAWA